MIFNDLIALLGKRIDSSEVVSFAMAHGVKVPLKTTTDNSSSGFFEIKKLGFEVSWSHIINLPQFFPPTKEQRKYVCYIPSIWFKPSNLDGLPVGLLPGLAQATAATRLGVQIIKRELGSWLEMKVAPDTVFRAHIDDGKLTADKWSIALDQHTQYESLKSEARSHAFLPWQDHWPNEQADLSTGLFMAWCIHRGFVGPRHRELNATLVEAVQARRLTGREFLYKVTYANQFWSWDIAAELHRFAHIYFACLCHRNSTKPLLGRPDRCGPDDDFVAVFNQYFPKDALVAADTWNNFDRFALMLDARYADFLLTRLETEIEPVLLRQVQVNYMKSQAEMAKLPPPDQL
jgi:hypothetical protein